MGDTAFGRGNDAPGGELRSSYSKAVKTHILRVFSCAEEVSTAIEAMGGDGKPVRWVVASDATDVRHYAMVQHPKRTHVCAALLFRAARKEPRRFES